MAEASSAVIRSPTMPADSLANAVNEEIILPHGRTSNPHDNVLETFRPSSSPHVFGNSSYEGKDSRREKGDGIFRLAILRTSPRQKRD
jgi:hypothetical protein